MKFVSVSQDFFNICSFDKELLHNKDEKRPYLMIVKLYYKGIKTDFAIPFRSNIPKYVPKKYYYSLPPRKCTKPNHIHGLHYSKMFPVKKEFFIKFNINQNDYYQTINNIVIKNRNKIIQQAQEYLNEYEKGNRAKFCTNINNIFYTINSKSLDEVAITK